RNGHQPKNRQCAWARDTKYDAVARGRGNRVGARLRKSFAASAHDRSWHDPEIPESARYFRLLVRCGPNQTSRLTVRCQFDILQLWLAGVLMQFDKMKRREFLTLVGSAAVAWPGRGARAAAGDAGDRASPPSIA